MLDYQSIGTIPRTLSQCEHYPSTFLAAVIPFERCFNERGCISYAPDHNESVPIYLLFQFMKENTHESVLELNDAFEKEGVKLAPGTGFYCEDFGWFRLTFAKPRDQLETGL